MRARFERHSPTARVGPRDAFSLIIRVIRAGPPASAARPCFCDLAPRLDHKQKSGGTSGEARSRRGVRVPHRSLSALSVIPRSISQWRVTQQTAISRPNSFPSRPRGPSWTSRRPTRSGQSRPRWRFPSSMRAFASPLRRVELADRARTFFRRPNMR
jgi:hypothetical protein